MTIELVKAAVDFVEKEPEFLWRPYLPIGEYSVLLAAGGTGKTILACGIAAAISAGSPLPGDTGQRKPRNILFVSAEDSGAELRRRLRLSGADLSRCFIVDAEASDHINLDAGFDHFAALAAEKRPALIVIDPWHGFISPNVDVGRINAVRPIFHRLANLCKQLRCSAVLISHVNKRSQSENANHAALGSVDLINASRSTMQAIFDEADKDCRIMVHTKSNFAGFGQSLRYRIDNGGLRWDGISEITRETLEEAARFRTTPKSVLAKQDTSGALIAALESSAGDGTPKRYQYNEFIAQFGAGIYGNRQPKKALDSVAPLLYDRGIAVRTDTRVTRNGDTQRGFSVIKFDKSP